VENFFSRYRNASLLVLVLFAQVLGLAVQVKRTPEASGTRLLRVWTVNAITPLEKALVNTNRGFRNLWRNYFYLRGVRRENRELKAQIEQLRVEQVHLSEDAAQARRLQILLGFKEQFISKTTAAQVIGTSGSDQSHVIYIDKGASDGVKPDMAVITPDGIVGKVLRVFHSSAQVLLINDPDSGVGVILESSRLQGILRGTAAGETTLRYVMSDEKVAAGERVLTSGGDRIFPKGFPVGSVLQSSPGSDLFLNIRVRPAADLSRLEEVLVVTKMGETSPQGPDLAAPLRAADILAERLPGVSPKPTKSTSSSAGSPLAQNATAKPQTGTTASPSASANSVTQPVKPAAQLQPTGQGTDRKPSVNVPKPSQAGTGTAETKPAGSPSPGVASGTVSSTATNKAVVTKTSVKSSTDTGPENTEGQKTVRDGSAGQPPKPAVPPPQTTPPSEDLSR
jgi:rod shape-determining protein MreC